MLRRRFTQHLVVLTGGILGAGYMPAEAGTGEKRKLKGRVLDAKTFYFVTK